MRIGSALSDHVPLLAAAKGAGDITILDKISGVMGDDASQEEVGRLGLGGSHHLEHDWRNRPYHSYYNPKPD